MNRGRDKNGFSRAREVAQKLRACVALELTPVRFPAPAWWLTNVASGDLIPHLQGHAQTDRQTDRPIRHIK